MKLEKITRSDSRPSIGTEHQPGKFTVFFNGNSSCPAAHNTANQLIARNNAFEPVGALNDIKNILLVTQLDMDNGYSGKTADGLRNAIAKLDEVQNA